MNRVKKLLSIALIICMLLSVLPISAGAGALAQTEDYQEFLKNLGALEGFAEAYSAQNPGKDPVALTLGYIRTGVEGFASSLWNAIAGNEDPAFARYVDSAEAAYNAAAEEEDKIDVTGLKDLTVIEVRQDERVDMGHMFAVMDVCYRSNGNTAYTDAAGWAGDLVDLLALADSEEITGSVEEMTQQILDDYLLEEGFTQAEYVGDLAGFAIAGALLEADSDGSVTNAVQTYFAQPKTNAQLADGFLKGRLDGVTLREDIRNGVFAAYSGNGTVQALEEQHSFSSAEIPDLRKACCYAFADYLCIQAGDRVQWGENLYYQVIESEKKELTAGVTLQTVVAENADSSRMVYHVATADVTNPYVNVYVNYKNNDPSKGWGMSSVTDQAHAAEERHSDPSTEHYIPNYNVVAAINGAGYTMSTGAPVGLLMMEGVEYKAPDGLDHSGYGFFGILKDGSAVIGSTAEYYELKEKGLIMEGLDAFGYTLVKDGKMVPRYSEDHTAARHARTAVGITKTGKVVFMVIDGRQEPYSIGGSLNEMAQIMLDAGCVAAVNLDGGGSSTLVAQLPGDDDISVANRPTEGFERTVSTSLMIVSTLPPEDAFDHAVVDSQVSHLTVGAAVQMTAAGYGITGEPVDLPAGASWAVTDPEIAEISKDGVLTGLENGQVEVRLLLGQEVLASKTMYVVVPDAVYFTADSIRATYGEPVALPVAARYEGKPVAIHAGDVSFTLSVPTAGTVEGLAFTGSESAGIKTVTITAQAAKNEEAFAGSIQVNLRKTNAAYFDFENAAGGDLRFAWDREVSNATTSDRVIYSIVDGAAPMVTDYTFALDMSRITVAQEQAEAIYSQLEISHEGSSSAWALLMGLADQISPLTEIKLSLRADANMAMDISELAVSNEFFALKDATVDDETNTLTLTLGWKAQTQAVDPSTADPVCILSGITLTPETDAQWDDKGRLALVHTGDMTLDIFVCGDALYSFAGNAQNQERYALHSFADDGGKGAHFVAFQTDYRDEYILKGNVKNGWVYMNGGYAYFENGRMYTGVRKVGQYYYDFGEDGINMGQTKYTGIFDQSGKNYYAIDGVLSPGWYLDGEDRYCFDENGLGHQGEVVKDEVPLKFENGLLVGGHTGFLKKSDGRTYHYIDGDPTHGWYNDGTYWYYFHTQNGIMITGTGVTAHDSKTRYDFASDGRLLRGYFNSSGYYYWVGEPLADSWVKNGGDPDPDAWYLTNSHGHFVTDPTGKYTSQKKINGVTYTVVKIEYDGVMYTFDNTNGKLLEGGIVQKSGKLQYYWAGELVKDSWIEHDGKTYYAKKSGSLAVGIVTIEDVRYQFDEQGRLIGKVPNIKTTPMYRLFNPNSGEHFYTGSVEERNMLISVGWVYEGVAWNAPISEGAPVYRLFNPNNGDHHYTMSWEEVEMLEGYGWVYEGVAWNSAPANHPECTPLYRLYNPNAQCGIHHYTGSEEERDFLVSLGWHFEGVGWLGLRQ